MPADLAKIKELFLAVLELPATEREAYLDTACAGDNALRRRLDAMLQSQQNSGELLPRPPGAMLAESGGTETDGTAAFAAQPNPTVTQSESAAVEANEFSFLPPSEKPGHLGRLGHYEVQETIGRGGFGIVFKAFDERLHRVVAIKVLSPAYAANGSARKRFIREARAAAAVKNEHVVGIHDVQEDAQPPYLVMEFIDGIALQDKIDKVGTFGVKEILRIGIQIAEGLTAAHKQGLVHRDIKPANILLENGVERVKITDFGLARAVDDASVTQSGTVAGTPMYMSPEQAEGLPIDHRSDLFSLGTVLYAMCTGHPPFRATGTMAVLKRVIEDTPRPIGEINSDIPDWLCDIITKLHAKKPADRYQTAKEVAELLGQHLAHLQQPGADPVPTRAVVPAQAPPASLGQVVRGHGWFRSLLGLGFFVIISAGMVFYVWSVIALGEFFFVPTLVMVLSLTIVVVLFLGNRSKWTPTGAAAPPPPARRRRRWLAGIAVFAGLSMIAALIGWRFWLADRPPGIVELHWDNPNLYIEVSGDPMRDPVFVNAARLHEELKLPPGNYKARAWFAFPDGQVTDATEKFAVHAGERTRIVLPEWGQIHIPQAAPDDELFVNGKLVAPKRIDGKVVHVYLLPKGEINWEVKRIGASVGAGILSLRGGMIFTATNLRAAEPGWVRLFDGKSLAGWKEFGDNRVRDGEITLFPGSAIDTIAKMPPTFHLGMEVKLTAGEGMIRIHAPPRDKHVLDGDFYEGWTFRFTEAAGGKVDANLGAISRTAPQSLGTIYAGGQARCGEWFYLEIIAKENVTEVRIDGRRLDVPLKGTAPAAGVISLANIGRRDSKIMFRNIAIKDLAPSTEPKSVPAAKGDKGSIEGVWAGTTKEGRGLQLRMEFNGEKVTVTESGAAPATGTYKIDSDKSPATLDVMVEGKTILFIYELKGDELKLCVPQGDIGARPSAFETTDKTLLIILKRQKSIKELPPEAPGWLPLFNGKDLTGWTPTKYKCWHVKDGLLTADVPGNLSWDELERTHAGSDHFHLRLEGKLGADSGMSVSFHMPAKVHFVSLTNKSISLHGRESKKLAYIDKPLAAPDKWFNLELIAEGPQIRVLMNGESQIEYTDPVWKEPDVGEPVMIRCWRREANEPGALTIKKLELKELRPGFVPFTHGATIAGWGQVVDPTGKCHVFRAEEELAINVPAGKYQLILKNMDAPRVLREVKGDFTAQVAVLPFYRPGANEEWVGAGLVVWKDADRFVRFVRSSYEAEEHVLTVYVYDKGKLKAHKQINFADKEKLPIWLRVENRDGRLRFLYSTDAKKWHDAPIAADEPWPGELKVGVYASNSTTAAYWGRFRNLEIKELGAAAK